MSLHRDTFSSCTVQPANWQCTELRFWYCDTFPTCAMLMEMLSNSATKTDAYLPLKCFKYALALDYLLKLQQHFQQVLATQDNA